MHSHWICSTSCGMQDQSLKSQAILAWYAACSITSSAASSAVCGYMLQSWVCCVWPVVLASGCLRAQNPAMELCQMQCHYNAITAASSQLLTSTLVQDLNASKQAQT
jgi:hypothetical protein